MSSKPSPRHLEICPANNHLRHCVCPPPPPPRDVTPLIALFKSVNKTCRSHSCHARRSCPCQMRRSHPCQMRRSHPCHSKQTPPQHAESLVTFQ
uniref:Uncharacterized protein n=1 Tax=Paramormyrops kingsleyae TaxID=1676925 RepID=A0A3B3QX29_9TELE